MVRPLFILLSLTLSLLLTACPSAELGNLPNNPSKPSDPTDPTGPNDPADPTSPTNPASPNNPDSPSLTKICDDLAIADRPLAERESNEDVAKLDATSTLKNCYKPGEATTASFSITPTDKANLNATQFIITFAVVTDGGTNGDSQYKNVTSQVLDVRSVSSNPDIFSKPLAMDKLRLGLSGDVSFKMSNSAPEGNYTLVLYFYRGTNGFDASARIGRVVYRFKIDR